jgi:hypothetical protein
MQNGHVTCGKCAAKAKNTVMARISKAIHSFFAFFAF